MSVPPNPTQVAASSQMPAIQAVKQTQVLIGNYTAPDGSRYRITYSRPEGDRAPELFNDSTRQRAAVEAIGALVNQVITDKGSCSVLDIDKDGIFWNPNRSSICGEPLYKTEIDAASDDSFGLGEDAIDISSPYEHVAQTRLHPQVITYFNHSSQQITLESNVTIRDLVQLVQTVFTRIHIEDELLDLPAITHSDMQIIDDVDIEFLQGIDTIKLKTSQDSQFTYPYKAIPPTPTSVDSTPMHTPLPSPTDLTASLPSQAVGSGAGGIEGRMAALANTSPAEIAQFLDTHTLDTGRPNGRDLEGLYKETNAIEYEAHLKQHAANQDAANQGIRFDTSNTELISCLLATF